MNEGVLIRYAERCGYRDGVKAGVFWTLAGQVLAVLMAAAWAYR